AHYVERQFATNSVERIGDRAAPIHAHQFGALHCGLFSPQSHPPPPGSAFAISTLSCQELIAIMIALVARRRATLCVRSSSRELHVTSGVELSAPSSRSSSSQPHPSWLLRVCRSSERTSAE